MHGVGYWTNEYINLVYFIKELVAPANFVPPNTWFFNF